jgi:peptidoglycan DL-endopeptidase CwlO
MTMIGQPYHFGGAQPGGFDCSGLVQYAAKIAGVPLPRTTREQRRSGVKASRSDLKSGDLVFMRLPGGALHVGIFLNDSRFVHAPSTGHTVRIDSLSENPYSAGYLEARRIQLLSAP